MLNKKKIRVLHHALDAMTTEPQRQQSRNDAARKDGYAANDLARFKEIILAMRADVLEDIRMLRETTQAVMSGNPGAGMHHHGSTFMEHSMEAVALEQNAALLNRQTKLLTSLDAALKRIDNGTYGFCTSCQKLIEQERLEMVPHTQQCMQCKTGRPMTPLGMRVSP